MHSYLVHKKPSLHSPNDNKHPGSCTSNPALIFVDTTSQLLSALQAVDGVGAGHCHVMAADLLRLPRGPCSEHVFQEPSCHCQKTMQRSRSLDGATCPNSEPAAVSCLLLQQPCVPTNAKGVWSCILDTWASTELPYLNFGACAYTIRLLAAFGKIVCSRPCKIRKALIQKPKNWSGNITSSQPKGSLPPPGACFSYGVFQAARGTRILSWTTAQICSFFERRVAVIETRKVPGLQRADCRIIAR